MRRKARREKAKEKAKAKKAKAKATLESTPAQPSDTPASTNLTSPPNKKRKIDMGPRVPNATGPPPVTKKGNKKERASTHITESAAAAPGDDDNARGPRNIQGSVKIQDIVKSTSNRAKTARSRAMNMLKKHKKLSD